MTDTLLSAAKRINEGDLVMVAYPATEKTNNPARILDGEEFVVYDGYCYDNADLQDIIALVEGYAYE